MRNLTNYLTLTAVRAASGFILSTRRDYAPYESYRVCRSLDGGGESELPIGSRNQSKGQGWKLMTGTEQR